MLLGKGIAVPSLASACQSTSHLHSDGIFARQQQQQQQLQLQLLQQLQQQLQQLLLQQLQQQQQRGEGTAVPRFASAYHCTALRESGPSLCRALRSLSV